MSSIKRKVMGLILFIFMASPCYGAVSKFIWIEGQVISFTSKSIKVRTLMGPVNVPRAQLLKSIKLARGNNIRIKTTIKDIEQANSIGN